MRIERPWNLALLLLLASTACTGIKSTKFLNPDFDFSYVERVAILPFENLSNDQQAGARATRLFLTELLATGAMDVVEPGEVYAELTRMASTGIDLNREQLVALGEKLGAQALILGSVNESQSIRSGTVMVPVVTLDVRMVESETGVTVWAATNTEKGSGVGTQVLGTGGEPISTTTRRCVQQIIKTLVR
jgi:TolB-like protein